MIYDENGVVVRSWPAVHAIDGPVSFSLEWNGLKFVYGGDTGPNKWYKEYAQGADLAIHECFITVQLLQDRFGFSRQNAINVGTKVHTSPMAFGAVMAEVQPRMAVAYHFYNDFEVAPQVFSEIRTTYDGPLSLAKDFMVWNITKDDIRVRRTIFNEDSWPAHEEGMLPPEKLTWEPHHPMSDWLDAGRLSWPGVDEYD